MRTVSGMLVQASARFLEEESDMPRSSILRIDREVLRNDIPKPKLDHVQGLSLDEKCLGASKGFVTLAVNARTGEPLGMANGRDGHCLDHFFSHFSEKQKEEIKYLGIDRSNAYRAAALKSLPHVEVCYDAYHLAANMNETLDRIRRAVMKNSSNGLNMLMKGKRFILLRGREKISQEAREALKELCILNRELYAAYLLKEDFRLVFRAKDENEAVLRLIRWIRMCMESKSARLIRFAKGIRDKFNEVVNGVRCRINSARIESANAAIKRILAKACGLADAEYLFLKLRQIYFLRPQRRFKTPRASTSRFETDPKIARGNTLGFPSGNNSVHLTVCDLRLKSCPRTPVNT